jgi:ribosomal protein S18 acetylase RimI-like enzyme
MPDDYGVLIEEWCVYVVEHEGAVRGVLVPIPEENSMLLDNVAVAPAAQGLGLVLRMLQFAERLAVDRGYRYMTVHERSHDGEHRALLVGHEDIAARRLGCPDLMNKT